MKNKLLISIVVSCATLVSISSAYAFAPPSSKETECAKCHQLSKKEAATIFKNLNPGIETLDVQLAPVRGLWQVPVKFNGKILILYLDFSKKHIISGSVIDAKTKQDITSAEAQRLSLKYNKVDVSKIPLKDALVMGDKNAKYRVIVFDDPD